MNIEIKHYRLQGRVSSSQVVDEDGLRDSRVDRYDALCEEYQELQGEMEDMMGEYKGQKKTIGRLQSENSHQKKLLEMGEEKNRGLKEELDHNLISMTVL